jgi:subfamily B ATP-binding cassette protein MsbA
MYKRLSRYLRPHAGLMVMAVVTRIIAAALEGFTAALLIPFLRLLFSKAPADGSAPVNPFPDNPVGEFLRSTIGFLTEGKSDGENLATVIAIILATAVIKNLFSWWGGVASAKLQELVNRDLRDDVYGHIVRLPMTFHQRTKLGQLLSRIISDTRETRQVITLIVTQALQNASTIIVSLVLLFYLSAKLSLFALVIAPTVILAIQPLLRRLRRGYRRSHGELGEINSLAQEVLSGAKLVKAARAEAFEQQRFRDASGMYARGLIKVTKYAFMTQPITEIIGTVVACALLWLGAREVASGVLEPEALLVFLLTTLRLLQPLKQLSQLPAVAQGSFAAAERLFDVLDRPTESASDRGTREVSAVNTSIEFTDVTFDYALTPDSGEADSSARGAAVSGVSLSARKGEIVALVGPSGAGKSTLVDLIPRFYEPTAGRIEIDGVDTREIKLDSLRGLIGLVSQETVIFNDTVHNNIAYGAVAGRAASDSGSRPGARSALHAAVEDVAHLANAHEFISQLPQGYNTVLGERGTRLSGGQRQRISIARALLANPPRLIFDEATSALDTESERLVQEAIDRLLRGRTVFVIAHRLSTVMHADQILVMNAGVVVERGKHADLLELNGLYARLHAMQFRDGLPAAESEPGAGSLP